jgi:hypothetical protein
LFFAARVGETEIGISDLLVLDQLEYICGFHCWRSSEGRVEPRSRCIRCARQGILLRSKA